MQGHSLGVLCDQAETASWRDFSPFMATHENSCRFLNLANHLNLLELKKSESYGFIKKKNIY